MKNKVTAESYLLSLLIVSKDMAQIVQSSVSHTELDTPIVREFLGNILQNFSCLEAWANSQFCKLPTMDTHTKSQD